MIVISEQDYLVLKEQIKKELLEERVKPEGLNTILQREQSVIFNRFFPVSMFPEDEISRRRKLRDAIITLTNVCRPRKRLIIEGRAYPAQGLGPYVHSDVEFDYALQTFESVCDAVHDIYRNDITAEEIGGD